MISQKVIECSNALVKRNWSIAFVESMSAGKMCYEFSRVPQSGKILIGGLVCYDGGMKEDLLAVPHYLLEKFTPESAEVTEAMAQNFCRTVPSDICVAITGLSTSGGSETPEKPVGTIFLYFIFPHKQISKRCQFKGNAEDIVNQTIDMAASVIIEELDQFDKQKKDN
ncbi:CinA family protein [Flavobacterium sp. ARAG 55.4]|uniref:CinA family protein n=1 Tax=Flavobacterium plantiphilum TaxID=3163297 RepID=A0ABW8XYS0_9FLAO